MCGLAFLFEPTLNADSISDRISDTSSSLTTRGPDAGAVEILDDAVMIHHRLSIVGGESGAQPLWDEDRESAIVFNGEIYNYRALKSELMLLGVAFHTTSDTEVILNGFKLWGNNVFSKLDGMFACVIYNTADKKITMARDRHGIKPLYYHLNGQRLVCASTIAATKSLSGLKNLKPSPESLDQFLRLGFNFGYLTLHPEISQLEPGSILSWQLNSNAVKSTYWTPDSEMNKSVKILDHQEGQVLIADAILSQKAHDLTSGVFLSSGLDSTLINHHINPDDSAPCFTASFGDQPGDEWQTINENQESHAMHHRVICQPEQLINAELAVQCFDVPFADNAALPTWLLAEKARTLTKVVFSGDGADELFFGYRNHRLLLLEHKLKTLIPEQCHGMMRSIANRYPTSGKIPSWLRGASTLNTFNRSWSQSYTDAVSIIDRNTLDAMYHTEMKSQVFKTESQVEQILGKLSVTCPMKQIQALDWLIYLPGSVLTKVDRATMRHGVEARVPYLSNKLVDAVLPISYQHNVSLKQGKTLLRNWVPNSMEGANRKKIAFINPLHIWLSHQDERFFKNNLLHEALLDQCWFNADHLSCLVKDFTSGARQHANFIWALMLLKTYAEQNGF